MLLRTYRTSLVASWRAQSPPIRLIRLWLGLTWIYAGWTKASDPGFLSKTGSTYIGKTLTGYASSSPLGFLFRHLIERATVVGIIVMLTEFAIGLATLLWIAPTFMAFVGFTMSTGLWMAATWHVKPYFLASDPAYAVLWLAYFLTLVGKRKRVELALDRRGAIRFGSLGVGAVISVLIGRYFANSAKPSNAAILSGGEVNANQIIKVSELAIGSTHEFAAGDGAPAILFRTKNGVFAYTEICTHQGCTASYSAQSRTLNCPCHGSTFDPFNNAKVLSGPALAPLPRIGVGIKGDWIVML